MIRLEQVTVAVGGKTILDEVDLEIGRASVTTLIGPNGAGKSTLFGVASGDITAASGKVFLDERPLDTYRPKELAAVRAVLPQDHAVRFSFAVEEIVRLARLSHPADPDLDDLVVDRSLAAVELSAMRRRDVQSLSGGELARVGFARTLAQTTPLLLLDEPTARWTCATRSA